MYKKELKILLSIVLVVGIGLNFYVYIIKDNTPSEEELAQGTHSQEEVLTMFKQKQPLFDELAQTVIGEPRFWKESRRDEYDSTASIMSPDDRKNLSFFNEADQEIIKKFFHETEPSQIYLKSDYLGITYTNQERTGSFSFVFFFGTSKEDFISITKNDYTVFEFLDKDWIFYAP